MPEYPVLTPVQHGDKRFGPGDTLTLEPDEARPLLRDGSLGFVTEPEASAKPGKRGGKAAGEAAADTDAAAADKSA